MGKADRLSRQPDWQEEVGKENEDRMLVKKEWLEARAVEEVVIEGVDICYAPSSISVFSSWL